MWFKSFFSSDTLNRERIEKLESYHKRRFSPLLWVLFLGIILFVYWASTFEIDEVAKAHGDVIASSRVQVIQAVDGGVLAELYVTEGDHVKKGEILAKLNAVRFKASAGEIKARVAALKVKQIRLRAEIKHEKTLTFPADLQQYPDLIKVETALFTQRRDGLKKEMASLDKAIRLAQQEVSLVQKLKGSGDASLSEVIRTQRELNDAKIKRISKENDFYGEANKELTKAEDDLAQNEQILAQRQQQVKDSVFVSKVDGIVKNIQVTTIGGVLKAGDKLMEIIPTDDTLVIEAKVRPNDISIVRKGLKANVKFDPFDYTIYGSVPGKVIYVSPDTLKDKTGQKEEVYYRAHIKIGQNPVTTSNGKKLEILPGMTTQVDIKAGTRTLLDYLLKPIRKTLSESFGER